MYYLVLIITARQHISPEVTKKGPMQCMGLKICCGGMAVKRMWMLGVNVEKMKALTVKMDRVTLIGTGT